MYARIGFAGSRPLASQILHWVMQNNGKNIQVVGGVAPPFTGWWEESFADDLKRYDIPACNTIDELLRVGPQIIFSINYWKQIDSAKIRQVPGGIVNLHHSYLLKFKGRYSTSWAIIHARKDNNWEHGSTLHYIDEELDGGNIIDSWKCPITGEDTAESLFQRVEALAFDMFQHNFLRILEGVSDFLEPSPVSYFYGQDSNKDLCINVNESIENIYDFVRAWSFRDRLLPYFSYRDRKVHLSLYPQHVGTREVALSAQTGLSQVCNQLTDLSTDKPINRYFCYRSNKIYLHD